VAIGTAPDFSPSVSRDQILKWLVERRAIFLGTIDMGVTENRATGFHFLLRSVYVRPYEIRR
jgi:hypothetical protein